MSKQMRMSLVAAMSVMLLSGGALGSTVNKSISMPDGAQADGASSVNGSISIGANAVITGSVETVNGRIRIDANTQAENVETVNGSIEIGAGSSVDNIDSVNGGIKLGENVTVNGDASVVNGEITLARGVRIEEDVSNVNGKISVTGAEVGGDIETMTGDVTLTDGAILRGDLIVEKPRSRNWFKRDRTPRIVIGPNSTVAGVIRLEHKVELFISESANVGGVEGELGMDDAVRFSGSQP